MRDIGGKSAEMTPELRLRRQTVFLFTMEGVAAAFVGAFNDNNANLLLTRLNASDYELGLFATLTSVIGMLTLIPAAVFTDRLKNKRRMLVPVLFLSSFFFFLAACSPMFRSNVAMALVVTSALAGGLTTLSTSVWQAFFADAIPPAEMNRTYAKRNLASFVIHTVGQLIIGALLTAAQSDASKIRMHQLFFVLCGVFGIIQILFLLRIRGGDARVRTGNRLKDVWEAAQDLAKNRKFLFFAAVIVLFYATFRMDGTIFYLSQVKYLGLSEFWLNMSGAVCTIAQLISLPLWTRLNERMGVRFTIIFGGLGLVCSPFCIILPTFFDGWKLILVHLCFRFISDFQFATANLNLLQNLLQVIPEKNRSLSIAVYNTLLALVGSFMPMVGVAVYTAFGADQPAMMKTMLLMSALRFVSAMGMVYRWYRLRKEPR